LRAAPAAVLKEAFGRSARVYSPYVMIRSYQQWRPRSGIRLPSEIRPLLEATYAEPAGEEPEAWRELRREMEVIRQRLRGMALAATRIWVQPPLPDEEDIQTRYSACPPAQLLLAKWLERPDSASVRLRLMDDSVVVASASEWNFETAKAIHRNLVRVPRWVARSELARQPGWLTQYASRRAALGLVQPDGRVCWEGAAGETGLSYDREQGVVIDRDSVPHARREDIDESYD
jgi:CRISPR-associated endonuclease/helicase Cas3